MIDLTTKFLGLTLKNPLVCSSSTLCQDMDNLMQMEEAGASAVVLHSLFEEQLDRESEDLDRFLSYGAESFPEALTFLPDMGQYNTGPDGYLEYIRGAKKYLTIPVIASLNGITAGGWIRHARMMEEAGADALELNVYDIPTTPEESGSVVEDRVVELICEMRKQIKIPMAVKLSPFYTAPVNLVRRLASAGADAVVIFNRFYQPDFDLENLGVVPHLRLSGSEELLLRLHWTAIMYGRVKTDIGITGGVHTAIDVIKCMMAGARVAMMTSVLLKLGIPHLTELLTDLKRWLEVHEYTSIKQMQGSLSLRSVADPTAYERANYMRLLRAQAMRSK